MKNMTFWVVCTILLVVALAAAAILTEDSTPSKNTPAQSAPAPSDSSFGNLKIN